MSPLPQLALHLFCNPKPRQTQDRHNNPGQNTSPSVAYRKTYARCACRVGDQQVVHDCGAAVRRSLQVICAHRET
jgi:hypothetical protein